MKQKKVAMASIFILNYQYPKNRKVINSSYLEELLIIHQRRNRLLQKTDFLYNLKILFDLSIFY